MSPIFPDVKGEEDEEKLNEETEIHKYRFAW